MKQKTLIGIMGSHNQGKTQTITELFKLISLLPNTEITHQKNAKKPKDITEKIVKVGNHFVGILDGDYPHPMVTSIREFISERKCDVIVCRILYNNGDKIVNPFINKFAAEMGYRIFRTANYSNLSPLEKHATPIQSDLNKHSAKQILETISEILNAKL